MSLIAFSIRLDRIDESILYEAKDGSFWLSGLCTFEQDQKGRLIVVQSIPKERYAAGERGPAVGTWREIGGGNHVSSGKPSFNLSKYKKPPASGGESTADDPLFPNEEEGAP
jgi:hypothetical protein